MIEVDLTTLGQRIGEEIAVSDWLEITQARIDQFAEATDDRQWIHVDGARAARESPFRATIAHGFLTLSLVSAMLRSTMSLGAPPVVLNYGLNRVRFVTPVSVGSRVRARFAPVIVAEVKEGIQVTWAVTIERDGGKKPCCVAEWVVRYYTRSPKPEA
jgi:acyl dehydratase